MRSNKTTRVALTALATASLALVAACTSTTPAPPATTSPTATSDPAPATTAAATPTDTAQPSATAEPPSVMEELATKVQALQDAAREYVLPTDPVPGVADIAGGVVYYIPITQQTAQFNDTATSLADALSNVGLTVQTCDGQSNPQGVNTCLTQAVGAGAAAIIADSIPYGLGANGLDAAQAAGIPVLISNQLPDPAHPASATLAYITGPATDALTAVADWIIVDSEGTANVLMNVATDSPSTQAYAASVEAEFADKCPNCTFTRNDVSSANFPLIAPSTSAALLANPDINYVFAEFDLHLQPTFGGVNDAGRAADVKGAASSAQVSGLQMLANNNFLYVTAANNVVFHGWSDADAVLRLITGAPVPTTYQVPFRLFTRDNIGSISVTPEAVLTGEWFGPTDFKDEYLALWGVN